MSRFAVVTLAGVDGLSTEQRKRLTMAVELVTQPRVLFCDEPTSGLDGRGAMMVARVMQAVTCRGVAVVSTIHQPSAAIFGMFDELLLLQRGGKIVFNGPLGADAVNLVRYLQGAVPAAPAFVQVGALAAGSWQRLSCAGGASGTCKRTCMRVCWKLRDSCACQLGVLQLIGCYAGMIHGLCFAPLCVHNRYTRTLTPTCIPHLQGTCNPASWMFEVLNSTSSSSKGTIDLAAIWQSSSQAQVSHCS